jgi:hypothetical protein
MYFPAFDEFDLTTRELGLAEFIMRLEFVDAKLRAEFAEMLGSWRTYESLGDAIAAEFAAAEREAMETARGLTDAKEIADAVLPVIYTPGAANAEIREQAARLTAEVSAGSIILILDDVFQRLRNVVYDAALKAPTPAQFKIGTVRGGHLSTAVYAAGNAYRHIRDWEGIVDENGVVQPAHRQFGKAKGSLALLAQFVGLTAIANETICCAVVEAASRQPGVDLDFDGLSARLNASARDFALRYCEDGLASFVKVREALDYQDAMRNIELSHSHDERWYDKQE